MNINQIASYLFVTEYVDTNFGQDPDWDGSWDTYDPDYDVGYPDTQSVLDRAGHFVSAMRKVMPRLESGMTQEELQKEFYDVGNEFYGNSNLRQFFKDIYLVLTGSPNGARIGKLVEIWGTDEFIERMLFRMAAPHVPL